MRSLSVAWISAFFSLFHCVVVAFPYKAPYTNSTDTNSTCTCRKTQVLILGAGITGITAAQALSNNSIYDFLIVEYQENIGGRVHSAPFGKDPTGKPYVVELGANWAQGLGIPGGPENPVWRLVQKWGLENTPSDFDSIITYNKGGEFNFSSEITAYEDAFFEMTQLAGELLTDNLQDGTVREGLNLVGWKPEQRDLSMEAAAAEWWLYDGEQAFTPEESSLVFNAAVNNFTFFQFSEENNFIIDQRGLNTWIKGEASEFLTEDDNRLVLNTIITNITYSADGVIATSSNGDCFQADYAICTFSVGVLQHDSAVAFEPELPSWKKTAIEKFEMGTYMKIFMQFEENFWNNETQFYLYADPIQRGWYPIWQSLDTDGFFPDSHIIFVTLVQREAYRAEHATDAETQAEAMAVLRTMFPNITIPEPIAFSYPRWNQIPWAYGSYSNWPPGTTLEMHQNFRANVDRLWFAGEATSSSYFGYMHGAWFEGRDIALRISGLINGDCVADEAVDGDVGGPGACGEMVRYETLHGTTTLDEYNQENGWDTTSFQTYGLAEDEEEVI